ncbi:voltage-gated hydrogen channel 1-like [Scleropages formosus]|uniref:Voltage-gated hydrogen channel 1 n=1 Tax=Scleropages formosus TaxID=113540 RepID=A0A0P7TM65_SCLFO|nr:voltage-gated hydrogen channel 1-like [Scleropages formosus]
MARFLKHFTAVGDVHDGVNHWEEEEHHGPAGETEATAGRSPEPITFRDSLRRLFSSEKFQVLIVILVILDAIFVLIQLLLDLAIIKADHGKVAPQVFHLLSLAVLTVFVVELAGKLYAYRCEFFRHKFEVFDALVVVLSFVLDIVYISREDAFNAIELLIVLRLWRVARIINGILVTVKNRAEQKIHKLKETNDHLVQQVNELQQETARLQEEKERLQRLLHQNGISF